MQTIFWLVSSFLYLYSLLIFIRIILSWFRHIQLGKLMQVLSAITDPYLNWWRRKFRLRVGILDLSIIIAVLFLSFLQIIFSRLALVGYISPGFILLILLDSLWMAVSFLLGFCLLVLVLRFIAYISNRNMYSPFWQIIDAVSRPLLYRINRICFGRRLVKFRTSIITAIVILAALRIGGHFGIRYLSGLLSGLI